MKNKHFIEIVLAILVIVLVMLFVNPMGYLMPYMLWWGCLIGSVIAFVTFVVFVWQEKASDEREVYNRMFAGRVGFLAGATTILLGIITQSVMGRDVDMWLPVSFGVMILSKLFAAIYSEEKF